MSNYVFVIDYLGLAAGAGNAAAKHLARVACQDAKGTQKDPAMLMRPSAFPTRTLKTEHIRPGFGPTRIGLGQMWSLLV